MKEENDQSYGGSSGSESKSRSRSRSPPIKIQMKQQVQKSETETQPQELKKCFISKSDPLGQRHQDEIQEFLKKNDISIKYSATQCPPPFFHFSECTPFPTQVQKALSDAGFKAPSPIQAQSWSIAMNGNDMIGIAETGSGKTLAYILPAVVHIKAQQELQQGEGPIALVLAPTRELTIQIMEQFTKFAGQTGLRAGCVYGGQFKSIQQGQLKGGVEVIIACPGRLIDFLESGVTNLKRVTYLVLDEADRMLDMGFEPQIRKILSHSRLERQTLLFSATWPQSVQQLAYEFCRHKPTHIQIGSQELCVNVRIKQIFYKVSPMEKQQKLVQVLKQNGPQKYLIFSGTKRNCEELNQYLNGQNFKSMSIHGDKSQEQRDYVMKCFKDGKTRILLATDVAQRGLDIKDIEIVINYDMVKNLEDHVHRIGRTARGGKSGIAISLFSDEEDYKICGQIVQYLQEQGQEIPQDLQRYSNSSTF